MKGIRLLLTLAVFLLTALPVFAQEGSNPVGEAVAALLEGVVFPVLSAFLLGLVGVVLNKVRTKYNLNITEKHQQQLERLALQGIAYAEEKAAAAVKSNVTKITGRQKLDLAVAHILAGSPGVSPEAAERLVHSTLGRVFGAGATGKAAVSG